MRKRCERSLPCLRHDWIPTAVREDLRDRGNLATDQLLNAIYLVAKGKIPQGKERESLLEQLWKPLSSSEDS